MFYLLGSRHLSKRRKRDSLISNMKNNKLREEERIRQIPTCIVTSSFLQVTNAIWADFS